MRSTVNTILTAMALAYAPAAAVAAPPASSQISAEAFAQLPELSEPALSPNGMKFATKVAIKGESYLTIMSTDGSPPAFIKSHKGDIDWWRWVNDDWLVIGGGSVIPFGYGGEAYVTRAAGISADGRTTVPLLNDNRGQGQDGDDVIWIAGDGSPRVLISMQRSIYSDELNFWPSVYEVDVSTGKQKTVVGPHQGVLDWTADPAGNVRFGIGYDDAGNAYRMLYRTGDGNFREIRKTDAAGKARHFPNLLLTGDRALAIADDPYGFSGAYEYDLQRMALGRQLANTPGYDVAGFVLDRRQSKLLGIGATEQHSGVRWVDPEMTALQAEVNSLVQGASGSIISTSDDLKRAIVLFSSADSPGAYFLYDRVTGEAAEIGKVNPAIGLRKLHPVKTVRYKARDGLEIEGVLTLPAGRPAQKLPLIVMPHGGPAARDVAEWDWWTQFLADRGYAVIQPNYRGSTGYGTAFMQKGRGEWGLKMQDDLVDAIAYLAKEGIVDPARTCIAGASYGGYAAIRATQRDASHYRCAISYAGVSDLKKLTKYSFRELFGNSSDAWLREQAPSLAAVSPINTPEKTTIPLLLMHGRKDTRVTVDHSRSMAAKLKGLGRDVTYIEQPEADHFFSRSADRLEFLKAMEAFLAKHNPA